MKIWFDGVGGTGACRGLRGEEAWLADVGGCLAGVSGNSAGRLGEPAGSVANGGGNGDTDTEVTDADGWAL